MTPERYRRVGEIYRAAIEIPIDRRREFLEAACGGDDVLRHDVELLLVHQSEGAGWIDGRALDKAAAAMARAQTGSWLNRQVGHYKVLSLLGAGGMGEVYRARDGRLSREVAIKVLPVAYSTNPEWLHRFEREARAAGQLNHPNILTVFAVGIHENAADEMDFVINIAALKSGDDKLVEAEMQHLTSRARTLGVRTKFIIETAYLSQDEKIRACKIANRVRPPIS